ncbi:hypothetical protein ASG51_01485 [Methylobacterium sp. Leaf465]|nr:hypothetical protein ASG51_01485 [Methylobacterium sp. Leaf465]
MDGHVYGALGQPGVALLMAIVVGALAAWLAERLSAANMGRLVNIVTGILCGRLGNGLAHKRPIPIFGFSRNPISATVGAILMATIDQAVAGRRC